jgi:hypothetical protein
MNTALILIGLILLGIAQYKIYLEQVQAKNTLNQLSKQIKDLKRNVDALDPDEIETNRLKDLAGW